MTGQACTQSVCRDVCDGSKPCGAGFKCATGACVPECAVDNDCVTVRPFTICQGGACVPNGQCSFDSQCSAAQLCVSGTCAARSGTLVAGKGFTCTQPCDCQQGETCSVNTGDGVKYCIADAQPKWFVASGTCTGTCDGKTPATFTDLTTALASAQAGDAIALHAGDSFGPQTIDKVLSLAGGYTICAPNRWVRDDSLRTTLSSATGAITIPGTQGAPLDGVSVRNLDLQHTTVQASAVSQIGATFAPHLSLTNIGFTFTGPVAATGATGYGINCTNCNAVTFTDLAYAGGSYGVGTTFSAVSVTGGSGTFTRIRSGAFNGGALFTVAIANTTGPVTITGTEGDGYVDGTGGAGVQVLNGSGGLVTITGSQLSFGLQSPNGGTGGAIWRGIYVQGCPSMMIANNLVDGRGLNGSAAVGTWTAVVRYQSENSNGTVANNTLYLPTVTNVNNTYGYLVLGPEGNLQLTGNTSSLGGSTGVLELMSIQGVTSGPVVISQQDLSASVGTSESYGLYILTTSAPFVITDSTFRAAPNGGSGNTSYAISVDSGVGRIERSKFYGAVHAQIFTGRFNNTQIELYDNYFVGAASAGGNASYGLYVIGAGSVYAVNNTIDGGGAPTASPSIGIACDNTVLGTFLNNLVSGGNSPDHRRLSAINATGCINGASALWQNNYFWYPAVGAASTGNEATAFNAASTGNLVTGNAGCYDSAFSQPDYHITATSPCVDFGLATSTRKDGSAIAKDLDGNVRVQGASADVGAHEAK